MPPPPSPVEIQIGNTIGNMCKYYLNCQGILSINFEKNIFKNVLKDLGNDY